MKIITLNGEWDLREAQGDFSVQGSLPGCNYLDLIEQNVIDDPFWEDNETAAIEISQKDYVYARGFDIDDAFLDCSRIDLAISGLDTIAEIYINGEKVADTDNAFRTWRFDVTGYIITGKNEIKILIASPKRYMERESTGNILYDKLMMTSPNIAKIRKPQYHFGWDWGPTLPPSGVTGMIELQGIEKARIEDVVLKQSHDNGIVTIHAETTVEALDPRGKTLFARLRMVSPGGEVSESTAPVLNGRAIPTLHIENPQLWWCNGLGGQALYETEVVLTRNERDIVDRRVMKTGLRTIVLDTKEDEWGSNFRFIINGVPLFAKGADWIPSDSFVSRTSPDDLKFYIESARDANMNMLRVWGGGYYESDTFYELCDTCGILVWQDFAFACNKYPLDDEHFIANVRHEVRDNVRRLRHHPSLALWCGNNELFIGDSGKKQKKGAEKLIEEDFFYHTLREWINEDDGLTPYWPGSPCSGDPAYKGNGIDRGDTHLWQVWHGMMPIESFRNYPTRFCSEFGMESLPGAHTIRMFTNRDDLTLSHPLMLAHQKSKGGNEKMLFYLLSKYARPQALDDYIYLTQLIQSETVRMATEFWRINTGRCNGALYWQYNDCWPVASWSGIDYGKQFKALQYRAKHFNAMRCPVADLHDTYCDLYVLNDFPEAFSGLLRWKLVGLEGGVVGQGECSVDAPPLSPVKVATIRYSSVLNGRPKKSVALILELTDEGGSNAACQNLLLAPDKVAGLKKPALSVEVSTENRSGKILIGTDVYARYVCVDIEGVTQPLSDNFFDIPGGETREVTFQIPDDFPVDTLRDRIRIKTLADVKTEGNFLKNQLKRLSIRMRLINLLTWLAFKFI
ncbi:MAG: hypothetical protein LBC58_06005 [Clostridiales Family XIII bacterium]|jgi:beta-mannosidase|nr:hypothetical protein [Clostridiales Family XIII bacterium]